jgi:hypothetical protein
MRINRAIFILGAAATGAFPQRCDHQPVDMPCEDQRTARAIVGPDGQLGDSVELDMCVAERNGTPAATRLARTGSALCAFGSINAPKAPLCFHRCLSDFDCPGGQACLCASAAEGDTEGSLIAAVTGNSRCVPATCKSSADCGGFECGLSQDGASGRCKVNQQFHCRTAEDECQSDADCGSGTCRYFANRGHWGCFLYASECQSNTCQ